MDAKCTARMDTADMRSTNCLEENPFRFSLALISASVQSVRPAEGVWARDLVFKGNVTMSACNNSSENLRN